MNGAYRKIAQVPEVANHAVMARLFPGSPYSLPANLTAATKAHNLCNSLNIIERVRLFVLEVMPELYKTVPGFGDNEEYASQLKHYKIDSRAFLLLCGQGSYEDPLVVAVPAFLVRAKPVTLPERMLCWSVTTDYPATRFPSPALLRTPQSGLTYASLEFEQGRFSKAGLPYAIDFDYRIHPSVHSPSNHPRKLAQWQLLDHNAYITPSGLPPSHTTWRLYFDYLSRPPGSRRAKTETLHLRVQFHTALADFQESFSSTPLPPISTLIGSQPHQGPSNSQMHEMGWSDGAFWPEARRGMEAGRW